MKKQLLFSFLLIAAVFLVYPTPSEANHLAAQACSGYYGKMTAKKWPGGKVTVTCEGKGRQRGECVGESAQIQPGQSYHFSKCNCLDSKNPCMKVSNIPKGCKVISAKKQTNQPANPAVGGAPAASGSGNTDLQASDPTSSGSASSPTASESGGMTSANLACAANRESISEPINIDCSGEAEPTVADLTPTYGFYCIATEENCVTPGQEPGSGDGTSGGDGTGNTPGGAEDITPGAGEITPEFFMTPTEELLFTPTPQQAIPLF